MNPSDRSVRVSRLHEQGDDDLLLSMSVEERVAMMWPLAVDAWTFMGVKLEPEFPRHVVRVVQRER